MPERDMLSLGVMGMGAGGLRKFFHRRHRRRRRRRPGGGGGARWEGFEILVTPAPYCMPTGTAMDGIIRVCWDYKSMLGL